MKNRIVGLIALFVGGLNFASAQTLSQDADGKSTIVYQGANISLDLTKANLTFDFTNLGSLTKTLDRTWKPKLAWGINAYGKNEEGTSFLFNRGELQASAGLGGFLGLRFRIDPASGKERILNRDIYSLVKNADRNRLIINSLKNKKPMDTLQINALTKEIESLESEFLQKQDALKALEEGIPRQILLFYVKGGRNATSFKLEEVNPIGVPISKTFTTTDFYGGNLAVGANYEVGRWLLGLEVNREFTNNFETLNKSTYILKNTEVSGVNTLESQKEFVAYSGSYKRYKRIDLNFDAIVFSSFGGKEKEYIAWNLYVRHKISESKLIMPTYTNVGLGAYFFNKSNKFLGGFYVEAPDTFESAESKKNEPNYKRLHDRLTFGLVARFSFSAIVGPSF